MRRCPICQSEMNERAWLADRASMMTDLVVVEQTKLFKKTYANLHVGVCPKCGHVELYIDPKERKDHM